MANDAPKLRKLAKECRDWARQADRREDREKLEQMAKSWEALAAKGDGEPSE